MTLKEALKESIEKHDIRMLCRTVDQLRICHYNYDQIAQMAKETNNLEKDDFEDLMQECDGE